jgi:hypothetical protein
MTLDDLARQFVTIAAAERDKIAFRMIEGGVPDADVSENLETVDELNERIASAIRDTVPEIRALAVDAQMAALAQVSRDAFDSFLRERSYTRTQQGPSRDGLWTTVPTNRA